ncbi:MAG TPA: creatininase family protein, partial [Verrucomicrobiota bacterium]|nr:creatininase family protein [Verrucomicrobiota bacterium]
MKTWIPPERFLPYLTWKQVEALPKERTLLVLPTAAIEQHGHHLPLATDTLINNFLLGHALRRLPADLPVYALAPVCYGKSNEHLGFPGTLAVSRDTFMATLRDLGASVQAAGFRRLVFFNSHGGNHSLIDVMARDLRAAGIDEVLTVLQEFPLNGESFERGQTLTVETFTPGEYVN